MTRIAYGKPYCVTLVGERAIIDAEGRIRYEQLVEGRWVPHDRPSYVLEWCAELARRAKD